MTYQVEVRRSAKKELANLHGEVQRRVAQALRKLEGTPFSSGFKKLKGGLGYRRRVGDYRIVYTVTQKTRVIIVERIRDRKYAYK